MLATLKTTYSKPLQQFKVNKITTNNQEEQFNLAGKFALEAGDFLTDLTISYSTYGQLNADESNIIWVCHALTADANVKDWWPGLVGPNDLFNPDDYFIVCANIIGSAYGSTSPLNCDEDKRYDKFPVVSIRDNVKAFIELRKHLGIKHIHTIIGGSVGGHQAVEWAITEPEICDNLILLGSSAVISPWVAAFNQSQRLAIHADNTWGEKSPNAARAGLKAARSIALLSYRNNTAYNSTQNDEYSFDKIRKAESYQSYQGEKLVNRFNAYGYYAITKTMDSHDVGRKRGSIKQALGNIKAKTLVIAISTDILFPLTDSQQLVDGIANSRLDVIESNFGHDGFLVETVQIAQSIADFYQTDSKQQEQVAMHGLGCVGQGVYKLLQNNKALPQLKSIVVKHEYKARKVGHEIITTNQQVTDNRNIKTVIEVINDADKSYRIAKNAINKSKNFITANKKMVAENLAEIIQWNQLVSTSFLYEAAVAGSIPIIRNLDLYFEQSQNQSIKGIVNGSSNYILTQMFAHDSSYADALSQAQEKGFAEIDPIADVGGFDAKNKAVILAAHAFGIIIHPDQVQNFGIQNICKQDVEYAKIHNSTIKLVVTITKSQNNVSLTIIPELVPLDSELAKTSNEDNLIILKNNGTKFYFKGTGAGSIATGTAILSDLKACVKNYKYSYSINDTSALDNDFKIIVAIKKQKFNSTLGLKLEENNTHVVFECNYKDFLKQPLDKTFFMRITR
jgi:homoserine O-acetyltransferase